MLVQTGQSMSMAILAFPPEEPIPPTPPGFHGFFRILLTAPTVGGKPQILNSELIPKNWYVASFEFIRALLGETYLHGQSSCLLPIVASREEIQPLPGQGLFLTGGGGGG